MIIDSCRIPKNSEYGLVNPELYLDQSFMLPWIHDIRGLASCKSIMYNQIQRNKLDKILEFVLSHEYQSLPWSYGLAKYGSRYYVLGWAAHLPGFSSKPEGKEFAELLLTLEFMSNFPIVQKSETYIFPRKWLPEMKVGYWVGGTRMMIDERKGNSKAIECESTFRILRIRQMIREN